MNGLVTRPIPRMSESSRFPAHSVAGLAGTSFKHQHLQAILASDSKNGFFEVHAENYMGAGGPPHDALARIRRDYPVSLHGVCMSIGGPQQLDKAHLQRFKSLVDRYEPALVSEHLAWSTHDATYYNDLLPLPYTPITVSRVADHIEEVQETIGRPILLENPSTYVIFPESTMSETEFIRMLVRRTGCGLLLDVNNVFVSATNHGYSALSKRYAVYRNNVMVSLIDALAASFPATRRITGPDFFRAMARFHVRATPPNSPLLFEYGRDFADFIQRYEFAQSMPWLADIARIERAWLDAYHAADAEPLASEALALIPPERLADTVFVPHPATRVVCSRFPAVTIFAANRNDGPVGRIEPTGPEDALVTRPDLKVFVRRLPPGGAVFLLHLISGEPLGAAAAAAFAESAEFDLSANIAGVLEAGAFTASQQGDSAS